MKKDKEKFCADNTNGVRFVPGARKGLKVVRKGTFVGRVKKFFKDIVR